MLKLTFLGAVGTVTGSRYLIEAGDGRVLVDCGLFQGLKQLRLRNRAPFPVPPSSIDAVVVTHAHIDHTGYLPALVREGFKGPIHCTPATRDLCAILLPDSGHLQEEEADFANRHGISKHHPATPLYTRADAEKSLEQFHTVPMETDFELPAGLSARFRHAGHILGSAMAHLTGSGTDVLFTGDMGRPNDPVMKPPVAVKHAANLVMESTYGDRRHVDADPVQELGDVVKRTAARGGVVVIPSFAVGRAQAIMVHLYRLMHSGAVPAIPVFLDSPMAVDVSELYARYPEEYRIPAGEWAHVAHDTRYVNSVDESKAVDRRNGPMVIVSASGMATGGRVLHHLKVFAPDPKNSILFVGYQAAGTRGHDITSGEREVKMLGQHVHIRAEVATLDGLSAHADWSELIDWLRNFETPPQRVFATHGDPLSAEGLRRHVRDALGWTVEVPEHTGTVELGGQDA